LGFPLQSPSEEFANSNPSSETSPKHSKVKPATPADFDGNCEKGHTFFNSCMIYFTICFPNDWAHIHLALSFFKTDHMAHFTDKVLRSWRKGKAYYSDWDAFKEDFVKYFCPKDKQILAITNLEGTSWYQGRDLVEDYIDCFQELIEVLEYNDNKTIVIKLHKGLDPGIQNKVALLGDLAPDFNDLRGWYRASRKLSRIEFGNVFMN